MKLGTRVYACLLCLLGSLICEIGQAAIVCPPMPDKITQVNRDVRSDIKVGVGSLGKIKAGEVATKTEVVAKNLFEKYPNLDRVLTVQMMAATYCSMIADSASLSEKEKQERWEKFQERVFSFIDPNYPKPSSPRDSRKEPAKKTDTPSQKNAAKPPQVFAEESKIWEKSSSQAKPGAAAEKFSEKTSPPAEIKAPPKASSPAEKTSRPAADNDTIPKSCFTYNPDDLFIRTEYLSSYSLSDGASTLPFNIDNTLNAENLLQVARRFKRVCLVEPQGLSLTSGRTDAVVEWMEPSGRFTARPTLQCQSISAEQLGIERDYEKGPFFITSYSVRLLTMNSLAGATTVIAMMKQHSKICIVGFSPGIGISSSRVAYFE